MLSSHVRSQEAVIIMEFGGLFFGVIKSTIDVIKNMVFGGTDLLILVAMPRASTL